MLLSANVLPTRLVGSSSPSSLHLLIECIFISHHDAFQYGLGDYDQIRDLQAQATLQSGNQYRILVFLYDNWGSHIAPVKLNEISYTIQ